MTCRHWLSDLQPICFQILSGLSNKEVIASDKRPGLAYS